MGISALSFSSPRLRDSGASLLTSSSNGLQEPHYGRGRSLVRGSRIARRPRIRTFPLPLSPRQGHSCGHSLTGQGRHRRRDAQGPRRGAGHGRLRPSSRFASAIVPHESDTAYVTERTREIHAGAARYAPPTLRRPRRFLPTALPSPGPRTSLPASLPLSTQGRGRHRQDAVADLARPALRGRTRHGSIFLKTGSIAARTLRQAGAPIRESDDAG